MVSKSARSFVCLVLTMLALFVFAASRPEAGSAAPAFSLKSQDGVTVNLSDFHGKWVVLYFYPKDFTSGCTIEAHNFERDLARYEAKNAVILGISLDSVESHKSFCVKEGLNFKLLSDADQNVSKEYGTLTDRGADKYASRNTFLIDPTGKIAKVFADVNPSKHSEEVLATLGELQQNPKGNAK